MNQDIKSILIDEKEIQQIVERISKQITEDYKERESNLLLLGILKGSVVFMADLMRNIDLPFEIDFMKVSSYGNSSKSSGKLNITLDIKREDLSNLDILIVEDIVDSGRTLSYLTEYLKQKGAHSVNTVTLLDKPSRREVQFTPTYTGKQIPDEFVVGYGLDYAEKYRYLPYVAILKSEVYSK
ncbi:MAG: hypoxanthine phosphoribosyltransferase [Ruminococcaceae bacterium]|nr:hypoxanthine phosphoribosyltransferase [Oscillospiraceae bacterium]